MQFTDRDLILLNERGLKSLEIERQLDLLFHGSQHPELQKSAKIDDGIFRLSDQEKKAFRDLFENSVANFKLLKFIPASGAASRMFAHLLDFLNHQKESSLTEQFFDNLTDFAFYSLLPDEIKSDRRKILNYIFETSGFIRLPKALIPFHKNSELIFTAFDSHLAEALKYSNNQLVNAHFTIGEEMQRDFHLALEKSGSNKVTALNAEVNFSFQEKQTDTVSIDENNEIVRDEDGNIVFRPGGHGALLRNLNSLDGDIIFIRNIDNVVSPNANDEYISIHQEMAGMLIYYQNIIYSIQSKVENGEMPNENELGILESIFNYTGKKEVFSIHDFVFRPLRICGMVKNEGEPGGGPFWIKDKNGVVSLQIIESSQVNMKDFSQVDIFKSGTHFNPVDICCSIKNYKGEKYDLFRFRNDDYSFLAKKTYRGKNITILEHPGLWNGSMHHWLTLFIEIPNTVFNPVKTVNDLLRPAHLK